MWMSFEPCLVQKHMSPYTKSTWFKIYMANHYNVHKRENLLGLFSSNNNRFS